MARNVGSKVRSCQEPQSSQWNGVEKRARWALYCFACAAEKTYKRGMHAINWAFWVGLASSALSFVAFLVPKTSKEIGQRILDDLTLRVSYYDLERVYSLCGTQKGRLWVSGACVCLEWIGAYIIRSSIRLKPFPLWLWAVGVALNYAAFYFASAIVFRATNTGHALKRLLVVFIVCTAAVACLELADSDSLSDKIDEIFGSTWDCVEWGIKLPSIIFWMLSFYMGVATLFLWSSKILARIVSFVMWGVIGNKEGAVAGLFAFITLALGIVKALLGKS